MNNPVCGVLNNSVTGWRHLFDHLPLFVVLLNHQRGNDTYIQSFKYVYIRKTPVKRIATPNICFVYFLVKERKTNSLKNKIKTNCNKADELFGVIVVPCVTLAYSWIVGWPKAAGIFLNSVYIRENPCTYPGGGGTVTLDDDQSWGIWTSAWLWRMR